MASYFIDFSVAGPGTGTEGDPYKLFSSVPSLVAGDFVRFKRGVTYVGNIIYNSSRGTNTTLSSPITFNSYGTGTAPIIQTNDFCIFIDNMNGVVVDGLQFKAVNTFSNGGIRATNSGELKITNCIVEDTCNYGFRIENTGTTTLKNIQVTNNIILGTFGDGGIDIRWGVQVGGIYEDILVQNNIVNNVGIRNTTLSGNPNSIRLYSSTLILTTSSGTVDLNLFSLGVQVLDNIVNNSAGYGIAYAAISTGGTSTYKNLIRNNKVNGAGNGFYDAHMLWVAGCRDVIVEENIVDTSIMFQGGSFGTGIGIFIDNYGFDSQFNGSKFITVRNNIIRNTGLLPDGNTGTLETKGAGIISFLSSNNTIVNNIIEDCHQGIGIMGWFGTGLKASNNVVTGNKIIRPKSAGISTVKAADTTTVSYNFIDTPGTQGIYVENAGTYAATSYTEEYNNIVFGSAGAYLGGSRPTSTTTPTAPRTPTATNLTLDPTSYA